MVETIKISSLPNEDVPTSDDIVPMNDGATSTTKKVSFDEFGKAINYSNSISTNTENLLAVDGSNKLLLGAANELISTDASNTISVGSDGKLKGSASALTLNENEVFLGNASNQPISTDINTFRGVYGLPTDYIKDDIQYISSNQLSWQGKCRDSSDVRDFELSVATTATLTGAVADTTYNLFVAGNTLTDAPVVVWDTGSTPAGYTYYRRVLSIITDSLSNIINSNFIRYDNASIKVLYNDIIENEDTNADIDGLITTTVPLGKSYTGLYFLGGYSKSSNTSIRQYVSFNNGLNSNPSIPTSTGGFSYALINTSLTTSVSGEIYRQRSNGQSNAYLYVSTSGYIDNRND